MRSAQILQTPMSFVLFFPVFLNEIKGFLRLIELGHSCQPIIVLLKVNVSASQSGWSQQQKTKDYIKIIKIKIMSPHTRKYTF